MTTPPYTCDPLITLCTCLSLSPTRIPPMIWPYGKNGNMRYGDMKYVVWRYEVCGMEI